MRPPLMTVETELTAGAAVVTLAGECDITEAHRLERALRDAGRATEVRLDVGELSFLDSSALRVLYAASAELVAVGSRLVLVNPSPGIRRVLEIAGLDRRFEIREEHETSRGHGGSRPAERSPDSYVREAAAERA